MFDCRNGLRLIQLRSFVSSWLLISSPGPQPYFGAQPVVGKPLRAARLDFFDLADEDDDLHVTVGDALFRHEDVDHRPVMRAEITDDGARQFRQGFHRHWLADVRLHAGIERRALRQRHRACVDAAVARRAIRADLFRIAHQHDALEFIHQHLVVRMPRHRLHRLLINHLARRRLRRLLRRDRRKTLRLVLRLRGRDGEAQAKREKKRPVH